VYQDFTKKWNVLKVTCLHNTGKANVTFVVLGLDSILHLHGNYAAFLLPVCARNHVTERPCANIMHDLVASVQRITDAKVGPEVLGLATTR